MAKDKTYTVKDRLYLELIKNGVIAKITACIVILFISIHLTTNFNCIENANTIIPILAGVLSSAMTFLFVKKDPKKK